MAIAKVCAPICRSARRASHDEWVVMITLDGNAIGEPADFYSAFFHATAGLIPDYGGRNLDALVDDLRELDEPLEVVWVHSAASRAALGDWLERVVAALTDDGAHPLVTVSLL
jgi:RNAse (barnase) inhibitor barstar